MGLRNGIRLRNHCCIGNTTTRPSILLRHMLLLAVSKYCVLHNNAFNENLGVCRRQQLNVLLGLHVRFPILLSNLNETWSFSASFLRSPVYKI